MQTALNYSLNPTPQSMAHGLASLGRYGDSYMVHAAEGETVIPAEILLANPGLKADLFRQMQMMGIKDPNRYVVGNTLNSLNPVTGQPEFFWKRLRHLAPAFGAAIGQAILGPLGAPALAAGTAALVGEDPALFGIGTLATQALGRGISGAYGAEQGFGNRLAGFGSGVAKGLTDPFRALSNLFTVGPENPIAQGALGSTIMPKSAARFAELYPDQDVFSPYRTGREIQARRNAALESGDMFLPRAIDEQRGIYKVGTDAGGMSPEKQQLIETRRQLTLGSRNAGTNLVDTPFGTLSGDQFKEAIADLDNKIASFSSQSLPGLGSSGDAFSLDEIDRLVAEGTLRPGMEVPADIGGGRVINFPIQAPEKPSPKFIESLTSPQTLGNLAAFTIPAGIAYLAAKKGEDDDLTPDQVNAVQILPGTELV